MPGDPEVDLESYDIGLSCMQQPVSSSVTDIPIFDLIAFCGSISDAGRVVGKDGTCHDWGDHPAILDGDLEPNRQAKIRRLDESSTFQRLLAASGFS